MSATGSPVSDDRLSTCFANAAGENRAALIGYLTAGDPDPEASDQLLNALARQVDILEIGMPFSDPMADGPVIQAASERALAAGAHLNDVFHLAGSVRSRNPGIGIVLMGYANVAYAPGFDNFARRASEAGADGVLLVDLPPEESALECDSALRNHGLHNIRLLAPTSSIERRRLLTRSASGFLYYVSLTGVTGASISDMDEVQRQVEFIRELSNLPIGVGFGVKTAEQAHRVAQFADGVVVGSHFVGQIEKHLSDSCAMMRAMEHAASTIRQGLGRP